MLHQDFFDPVGVPGKPGALNTMSMWYIETKEGAFYQNAVSIGESDVPCRLAKAE